MTREGSKNNHISGRIDSYFHQAGNVLEETRKQCGKTLRNIAEEFVGVLRSGGTLYFCGNGGSAAGAQHLAAEVVVKFEKEREALAAIALSTDTSILTATANDFDFSRVFERQVEALVDSTDLLAGLSTSGNSPNVLKAIRRANDIGAKTIGFTGKNGGDLVDLCDISLRIPSDVTSHIQEGHLAAGHILCRLIEDLT